MFDVCDVCQSSLLVIQSSQYSKLKVGLSCSSLLHGSAASLGWYSFRGFWLTRRTVRQSFHHMSIAECDEKSQGTGPSTPISRRWHSELVWRPVLWEVLMTLSFEKICSILEIVKGKLKTSLAIWSKLAHLVESGDTCNLYHIFGNSLNFWHNWQLPPVHPEQ